MVDLSSEREERYPKVTYLQLYRFASKMDRFLINLGITFAVIGGALAPLANIIFSNFVKTLEEIDAVYCSQSLEKKCDPLGSSGELYLMLQNLTVTMLLLTGAQFLFGYGFCVCLKHVSENQVFNTKQKFFESLLSQETGWHDMQRQSKFISRLVQNGSKLQKATGEKLGLCVNLLTTASVGLVIAFYHNWLLTLMSMVPMSFLTWITYYSNELESNCSEEQDRAYGSAGAVATEVVGNIRTVAGFGGEAKEMKRYNWHLLVAAKSGINRGALISLFDGLAWIIYYFTAAFILWTGTVFLYELKLWDLSESYGSSPENVFIVYLNVIMAAYSLGQVMSNYGTFVEGEIAAAGFHVVIDRVPEIDSLSKSGLILKNSLLGKIEIKDVHFSYPSRPNCGVLSGINITAEAGKTTAFVGHSGCGKSTIIQLLLRFYDPSKGQIIVDNYDIKSLNVGWFRKQLGVVRQEPDLFNGTISENLRLAKEDATDEEIIKVCKQADAHEFITGFPEGYNTILGDRGALVSGGQKQRIAIARALLANPSILLLDEATSALDIESQHAIQATLEAASFGRTTIVIAHRLVTVMKADLIIYIKDGQILERGTHKELLNKKGAYFSLFQRQMAEIKRSNSSQSIEANSNNSIASSLSVNDSSDIEDEDVEFGLNSSQGLLEMWRINFPEWPALLLGFIASIIHGCVPTIHGLWVGYVISDWGQEKVSKDSATTHGIRFLILACISGISALIKGLCFYVSGENLTYRIRSLAFKSMINQDLDWFEQKGNHLGALITRLSGDAVLVQGVTGVRWGILLQGATTTLMSISLALFYSVKLGIVGILFVILLRGVRYLEELYLSEEAEEDESNVEFGSMLVTRTITQIRTIASLHVEEKLLKDYTTSLEQSKIRNLRPLHVRGFVLGLTQGFYWFTYILLAYYGSYLMLTGEALTVSDILAVGEFITFGTEAVSEEFAAAPNYYKAVIASNRITKLLKSKPSIKKDVGFYIPIDKIKGKLEFNHVKFSYPNRPSDKILDEISFRCEAGQHLAIVGQSGCGKSTIISMIQRFYDPSYGYVKLDDFKLTELDVECLRQAIGIVSQEAALFDRSIGDNIAYGDNSRHVQLWEIMWAAKQADIHEFIMSLPQGYGTRVGQLGGMLSGGQKQRIAIARAIIRHPSIFLFDEATSALDAETEDKIQTTLDSISANKTSITISHHPSAIRNSDLIIVLDSEGKLIDMGTHSKLMTKSRFYSNLISNK